MIRHPARQRPGFPPERLTVLSAIRLPDLRKRGAGSILAGRNRLGAPGEVDRSYVGRVERGDNNVAVLTLARLAVALDLTVAKLMQRAGL
jgi:transcriptional regulator with XRE-family HTH domain